MAQPFTIHSQYAGMARDSSRDALPPPYVWNLQDFIPNQLGAPLRKRGGYVYASSAMTGSSISRVMSGVVDDISQLFAIDAASSTSLGPGVWVVSTSSAGDVTFLGSITAGSAGSTPANNGFKLGNPVVFDNKVVVPLGTDQKNAVWAAPVKIEGGVISRCSGLSATDPGYHYAGVYGDRVVLGNSADNPHRLRFSAALAANDFTDGTAWIDCPRKVNGLVGLANVLLIFSLQETHRIRGKTPPPGSDMILDKLSDYGCVDHRSIATWSGKAVYADTNGVYLTDGINTADLIDAGQMRNYYQPLLANYTSAWELNGGVFRDYYYLAITDGPGGTFRDCLVCDLRRRAWFRFQNFPFRGYTELKTGGHQDLYAACGDAPRLARVTDIYTPTAANKNDANGTPVLPVIEYPAPRGYRLLRRKWITSQGLTRWNRFYLSYDLRDAATDNPTMTMSYVASPGGTSYTAMAPALPETTDWSRAGRSFGPSGSRGGKIAPTVALKVAQTVASADTSIYTLQAEYTTLEESRIAQS